MLLWLSFFGVLALILAVGGLLLSMSRAERRARRNLYRSLGLAEATVEFLMERNRDVLTELSYVRHQGEARIHREALPRDRDMATLRRDLRFSRPDEFPPADDPSQGGDRHTSPPDGHTRH